MSREKGEANKKTTIAKNQLRNNVGGSKTIPYSTVNDDILQFESMIGACELAAKKNPPDRSTYASEKDLQTLNNFLDQLKKYKEEGNGDLPVLRSRDEWAKVDAMRQKYLTKGVEETQSMAAVSLRDAELAKQRQQTPEKEVLFFAPDDKKKPNQEEIDPLKIYKDWAAKYRKDHPEFDEKNNTLTIDEDGCGCICFNDPQDSENFLRELAKNAPHGNVRFGNAQGPIIASFKDGELIDPRNQKPFGQGEYAHLVSQLRQGIPYDQTTFESPLVNKTQSPSNHSSLKTSMTSPEQQSKAQVKERLDADKKDPHENIMMMAAPKSSIMSTPSSLTSTSTEKDTAANIEKEKLTTAATDNECSQDTCVNSGYRR